MSSLGMTVRQIFGYVLFFTCVLGVVGCNAAVNIENQNPLGFGLAIGFWSSYVLITCGGKNE